MATAQLSALQDIEAAQKSLRLSQYGGRMSNQFVDEVKGAALFQFNWGELLGAAPTAISMMCACYVAASNEEAKKISLKDSMPTNGFQYLINRPDPTLRASLLDVCNSGGQEAFGIASNRMENLKQLSFSILNEHIPGLFGHLEQCTESEDNLDDMRRALKRFGSTTNSCAKYAAEIHLAFNRWSKMVMELHITTEQESGTTARKASKTELDKQLADIEKTFADKRTKSSDEEVKQMEKSLERAEKRLDRALDNVPGPWATVLQSAASSFAQALPAITAAALPLALASANPLGAAAGGVLGQTRAPITVQPNNPAGSSVTNGVQPSSQPLANDPASAAAYQSAYLFTAFFAFLGGDDKDIDWKKFEVTEANAEGKGAPTEQSGVVWLLGQLQGELADVPKTETEATKKLASAFTRAISVANEIRQHLEKGSSLNSEKASAEAINKWKAAVKAAKNDVLTLSAASGSTASVNSPNPFTRLNVDVPKPDLSAQTAQLNGAMQGVQVAQNAVDAAQANYDSAIKKQEEAAAAMLAVEQKLKTLNDKAKLLENVKAVLSDCISVLVDLSIQVSKLEKFFSLLCSLIESIILKKTDLLAEEMSVVAERSYRKKALTMTEIATQTIYTSTLQSKAYFSMLYDITYMYIEMDRDHITPGLLMCNEFSGALHKGTPVEQLQERLRAYNEKSGKALRLLIQKKQDEIMTGLKDRARAAIESSKAIEAIMTKKGLDIDTSAKLAIEGGAQVAKEDAKGVLATVPSLTAASRKVKLDAL
ncbi:uncharacterized protein BKA55DRAFT_519951 [Fusarium redolens]|uniref:Uncharacterized protein n=1 Tax=Fusarium redolens TaxID=48865 RepID=A0A9P9GK56_FUSRE|nr:uncharacterized protein BKA55DRAFT_519951 [Fusarium redolens]KAH7239987.1 hypothetical protein BKA55DRAFT_519951 [Fusarium redolens]